MSPLQWGVVALNVAAFLAMVTAFAVGGWRQEQHSKSLGEETLPPMTPGWEYREGLKTLE